ncbi:MAG: FAD-dependent monooxygenase [Gammaproteobacteria bacterium]
MHSSQVINKIENPDVVLIGAGPIGLRFAMELAALGLKVVILEKNRIYSRTQDLALDHRLIETDAALAKRIDAITEDKEDAHHNVKISIQDLEKCLSTEAQERGVETRYTRFMTEEQFAHELAEREVESLAEIEKILGIEVIVGEKALRAAYPKCKLFIGTDGAHSSIREMIASVMKVHDGKEKSTVATNLQYMIEMRYEVSGKDHKLNELHNIHTQLLLGGFLCTEDVKYDAKTNKSIFTLRFLVDQKTFEDQRLVGVNAKNLLPISQHFPIPRALKNAFNVWQSQHKSSHVDIHSGTINKTTIGLYASNFCGNILDDTVFTTAGDALFGFPYMNGLNASTEFVIKATKIIKKMHDAISINSQQQLMQAIEEYQALSKEIFEKVKVKVLRKDRDIHKNRKVVKSAFVMSSFATGPELLLRRQFNLMFATKNANLIDFDALNEYVDRNNRHKTKTQLAMNVLLALSKINLQLKKGEAVDFDTVQQMLKVAYVNNRNITIAERDAGSLSSSSFKKSSVAEEKQIVAEISAAEMQKYVGNTVIPKDCRDDENKRITSKLHDALYQAATTVVYLAALQKDRRLSNNPNTLLPSPRPRTGMSKLGSGLVDVSNAVYSKCTVM